MQKVLITGGTGLIGSRLSVALMSKGYQVSHLSRKENLKATFPAYKWNIDNGEVDVRALEQADYIVHLAGAGVADKPWTAKRKQLIIDSRVKSGALLQQKLKEIGKRPKAIVCASASGFYGNRSDEKLDESAPKGQGFLSDVVEKWEAANDGFKDVTDRLTQLRIGIVLSTQGGALQKMLPSYKFRIGAYFGSGQQCYSWIHIDDLVGMFAHAIEEETVNGTYNAVAPNPVTNKYLAELIGKVTGKPALLVPAPAMVMRLVLGEMSTVVLDGARLSTDKIRAAGFDYLFVNVNSALRDLITRNI